MKSAIKRRDHVTTRRIKTSARNTARPALAAPARLLASFRADPLELYQRVLRCRNRLTASDLRVMRSAMPSAKRVTAFTALNAMIQPSSLEDRGGIEVRPVQDGVVEASRRTRQAPTDHSTGAFGIDVR